MGYDWWWYGKQTDTQSTRPDAITLVPDKKQYRAGDTIRLKVVSPHAGQGFVVVEGDKPLWSQPITVGTDGTTTVEIPVAAHWQQHNLYLSAMVLRPLNTADKITVNRAMGLTHLKIDRQDRQLAVTLTAPEKIRPEQTLSVSLQVQATDVQGNKSDLPAPLANQTVAVTLAAVDVGVLGVTNFQTPDPFAWFYGQRRYTVKSKDLYNQVIEAQLGPLAKLKFGGDSDLARGGTQPLTDVRIISLFTGPVTLDGQGQATIPVDIPDFNGRLRLTAIAFGPQRFGSQSLDVKVAAPIIAEISLPRFLAPGDQSLATLSLRNMSEIPQTIDWQLSSENSQLTLSAPTEQVTLQPGEKQDYTYSLYATHFLPQAILNFQLNNQAQGDEEVISLQREWRLGLRPAYPAQTRRHQQVLQPGESLTLPPDFLTHLIPETRQLSLNLSTQPAFLNLKQHLSHLLRYPYGCLEQTTSTTFPFLFVDAPFLTQLGINNWGSEKRKAALNHGLAALAAKQRNNGSFGLWSNKSPEEHYLTVYAAELMLLARQQGYTVSKNLINQTLRRLQTYLNRQRLMGLRYSEDKDHYRFAYRAYAGYVLTLANKAPLGTLRTLYDHHRQKSKSGLPLIHLGIALSKKGDLQRGQAAIRAGLAKARPVNHYYGDYGTPLRDQALMLALLKENRLAPPDAGKLIFDLAERLRGKSYLSTQEQVALVRLGAGLAHDHHTAQDNLQKTVPVLLAELSLNQSRETLAVSPHQSLLRRHWATLPEKPTFDLVNKHKQLIYAQLLATGYPDAPPTPNHQGVHVERSFFNLQGQPFDLQTVKSGDLILVYLAVTSEQRIPDLLVVDLLPAGLELENQNLLHGLKLDQLQIDGVPLPDLMAQTHILHQAYRDDRYFAALNQRRDQTSHLFYLARAVIPGHYQVPPSLAEDMYQPNIRSIGETQPLLQVHP